MKKLISHVALIILFATVFSNIVYCQIKPIAIPIKQIYLPQKKTVYAPLPSGGSYYPPLSYGYDLEIGDGKKGFFLWMNGALNVINKTKVTMKIQVMIRGCWDATMVTGSIDRTVYTVPEGWEIIQIDDSKNKWDVITDTPPAKRSQDGGIIIYGKNGAQSFSTPWGGIVCQFYHDGPEVLSYMGIKSYMFTYNLPIVIQEIVKETQPHETKIVKQALKNLYSCPILAYLTRGDFEFAGHGPKVSLRGTLEIKDNTVIRKIWMKFEETMENWSTAERTIEDVIYEAPENWEIMRIDGTDESKDWVRSYIDTNVMEDMVRTPWGVIVCMGDSNGKDILKNTGISNTAFTYEVPIVIRRIK